VVRPGPFGSVHLPIPSHPRESVSIAGHCASPRPWKS